MKIAFSNGTESDAWESAWCDHCIHDHDMHVGSLDPGCDIFGGYMLNSDEWPECWLPEPDDGHFYLPSRMVCLAFVPCQPCGGDPSPQTREYNVNEVKLYWRDRRPSS